MVPVQPPVAAQLVAFVLLELSVTALPAVTVDALDVKVTVGGEYTTDSL